MEARVAAQVADRTDPLRSRHRPTRRADVLTSVSATSRLLPARRTAWARVGGSVLPMLLVFTLVSCGESRQSHETRQQAAEINRFTDLLRLVKEQSEELGDSIKIDIWSLDGDNRSVLFQEAPGRLELSLDSGQNCRFRFGMGFNRAGWQYSDGVVFKVSLKQDGAENLIFTELIEPSTFEKYQWQDREVQIPDTGGGPFVLVLETDQHKKKQADYSAWSRPHVVCEETRPGRKTSRPDIILISLDTLRRDHLSLYGYSRKTSPNLDAFAAESVVFDNSFSTASYTLPAHGSMFTGLFPEEHGAGHSYAEAPLDESFTTIAETLGQAGYRTIGFTAGGSMTNVLGMGQGFEEWTERQRANLKSTLPAVFDSLGRVGDQPFFLFLHTYDVHAPYEQPEGARAFSAEEEAVVDDEWEEIRGLYHHQHHKMERFDGIEEVIAAYDSGIHYVDSQMAVLFDYLKEIGAYEDALIIVTSDHGESLFDYGRYFSHGHTLNDHEVRIPMIVRLPGAEASGRREDLVQILDVTPTILEQASVEPLAAISGRSLFAGDEARPETPEFAQGETSLSGARYVRSRDWKVISPAASYWEGARNRQFGPRADRFNDGWQIFDLSNDPGESENLFGRSEPFPAEVRRLIQRLKDIDPPGQSVGTAPPPEGELAENLRALGYL